MTLTSGEQSQLVERFRLIPFLLLAAAVVLTSAAWLRSAEYDEQYTLFVTAGSARPIWPTNAFVAGDVRTLQASRTEFGAIARDLRGTDVHPPLYFWAMAVWRSLAGNELFTARILSIGFSLVTLWAIAVIARLAGVPAGLAILLTIGCYGFAYTGIIARGFALAQMLSVLGVALLLLAQQRWLTGVALAAGTLLGAATFTNYLAAFVGIAALLWLHHLVVSNLTRSAVALAIAAAFGFAVWLPADLWFFLAQRQTRVGQFPPFDAMAVATQLVEFTTASLLGGLPLYFAGIAGLVVTIAMAIVFACLIALIIWHWRRSATSSVRRLLAMTAAAPATGLLLLGLAFDNTPIELRYLAFATPFIGLLLAEAFATLPRSSRYLACGLLVAIQAAALAGLATRQETMQPARRTAIAAAALVQDGIVLLPRGNDGVGIVGAFAIEAPSAMRLLVIKRDETAEKIRARVDGIPRAVLALLGQDRDSRATLPTMVQAFDDPSWCKVGEGMNVLVFERIGGKEPCSAPGVGGMAP